MYSPGLVLTTVTTLRSLRSARVSTFSIFMIGAASVISTGLAIPTSNASGIRVQSSTLAHGSRNSPGAIDSSRSLRTAASSAWVSLQISTSVCFLSIARRRMSPNVVGRYQVRIAGRNGRDGSDGFMGYSDLLEDLRDAHGDDSLVCFIERVLAL